MEQELSLDNIKDLTQRNRDIEARFLKLRVERENRERAESARHNVAVGEVKRWYNAEVAKLNEEVAELNKASKGLMPVQPRR